MIEEIRRHYHLALIEYTSGEHYETLLEAKEEYFILTGKLLEEDDDYEARMNGFNDWYLLHFVSRKAIRTPIKNYIIKYSVDAAVAQALQNVNHSLFEYLGEDSHKHIVILDAIAHKKYMISDAHLMPTFIKGDMFVGRLVTAQGHYYLLDGQTVLPKDVKNLLRKEAKRIGQFDDPHQELSFLITLESLKTRWKRYGHIDAEKIFSFN